jgi:hypothetical protein
MNCHTPRVERDKAVRRQVVIVDPEHVEQEILRGLASIERGELIELKDNEELQAFLADIVARGKKRIAAKKPSIRR